MTTYIQLLNKIEAFCDAHYQIQRYGGEFREQMPNLSTESEKYPIVFVTPTNGVPMYDTNQISLDIYCVDIIQKGRENLNTILSDCHLILTDLYGYFSQGSDLSIDVIGQPSQEPLNNLDLDYVAGWKMTIVFEVDGYCVEAIPMGTIPSGGGSCEDATYTISDDAGNTLYSGSITSGGSLSQVIQDSTAVLKDSAGTTISTTGINAEGSANITAPDATYSNSDASYAGNIVSGGTLSLPDETIIVTDENDNVLETINFPVYENQTINLSSYVTCPSPVGATLMKTGQTTSYRTGDDGDIEAGRSVDFFTLAVNNPFGNTNRFTDELGGSTYTNNIVIDWSTYDVNLGKVLGYYRLAVMAAPLSDTWDNLIDACLALSIGTFTSGWRMMNVKEAINIADYGSTNVYNYAPLNISFVYNYASSTTSPSNSAQYLYMSPSGGRIFSNNKTNANAFGIAVRNFTVSGTTLS